MAPRKPHPGPVAEGVPGAAPAIEIETRTIDRDLIHPDPLQPRKKFDLDLREDLRVRGQLDPITVRPHPELLGMWMIVNGERRWRSSEGVLSSLRCQIREDMESHAGRLAAQLSHNTGRPLEPLEEAHAFKEIIDETGMGVSELAEFLGRPKTTVGERLALLEIGPWLGMIEDGTLPLSHAVKVLLPLRTAADSAHAHAIEFVKKDYRFTRNDGSGISVYDFANLVKQAYLPSMYPLAKTKGYGGKQPEVAPAVLAKHDGECDCGGILFDFGGGTPRRVCGNPGWWRPLHRAALKKKPKNASHGREATAARTLHLPKGVPTLKKTNYGNTPDGVIRLTDANGCWSTGQLNGDAPFDPQDLDLDPKKLVQWHGYGSEYPRVGTKDAAAVKRARAAWHARYEKQYQAALEELQREIMDSRDAYRVDGPGVTWLAAMVLSEPACRAIIDVAQALGFSLPKAVLGANNMQRVQPVSAWLRELRGDEASQILTGCAVVQAKKITLPIFAVEKQQERAIEAIRKRTIPWKAKPKAEKEETPTATKKVAGRAAAADFMKPLYPSPALAAVVGAKPLVRTEVTKKLWAYIKRKGLQDAKNRRTINADAVLQRVFGGKKSVSMFDMTKIVNKHLAGTAAAAALIYAGKKKPGELALEDLSEETAELPLGTTDEDNPDDGWTTHQEDDDLWDSAGGAEDIELEEAGA